MAPILRRQEVVHLAPLIVACTERVAALETLESKVQGMIAEWRALARSHDDLLSLPIAARDDQARGMSGTKGPCPWERASNRQEAESAK